MRVLCLGSFPTAAERAFTAAGFAALVRPTKKAEKRPTITDDEVIPWLKGLLIPFNQLLVKCRAGRTYR